MLRGSFKSAAQRSYTPAAVVFRLLAGAVLHPLYDLRPMLYRTAGTGCILKTFQPLAGKTAAPLTDGHFPRLL